MTDFSMQGGGKITDAGFDGSNTRGTLALLGASDLDGSWTEIVSAAENVTDSVGFTLILGHYGAETDANVGLIDVAIGASGSEQVIIEDIVWHVTQQVDQNFSKIYFPVHIPAGVRIAVGGRNGSIYTPGVYVHCLLHAGNLHSPVGLGRCTTYGADTSNSKGTSIPRTTVHTLGSWTEITSSTDHAMKVMIVGMQWNQELSLQNGRSAVDIGVGSSGNEEVVIERLILTQDSRESQMTRFYNFPVEIPAGTRVAARCQGSVADADLDARICIYGID